MAAPSTTVPASLRRLRDLNTDDLLHALALGPAAARWPVLRRLFDGPSLALARRLQEFDTAVGRGDAALASRSLIQSWGARVATTGVPLVTSGPRLFVANHPGLSDVLALLTVLDQSDLRIVARDRPFLRALPGVSSRLFLIEDGGALGVLRRVRTHLADGGAVLTFPAGRIEPDPAWRDPRDGFRLWSASTALWAKTVPGLVLQPLLVGGVRHPGFVDPWFARWRRPADRDWTAAVAQLSLQVLFSRPRNLRIEVAVGPPLASLEPLTANLEALARQLDRSRSLSDLGFRIHSEWISSPILVKRSFRIEIRKGR